MESRKRKREEYEMQLFGFHSRAVYATLKSIVMDRIQAKNRKLCETLEKVYNTNPENLAILKTNERQLVNAYYTAVLPHLKHVENTVNKFISVPPNVLAEEDGSQRVQYTAAEVASLRRRLDDYQQRAKRATILNEELREESRLIEESLICADNASRLSHVIEKSDVYPNIGDNIHRLVRDYKKFRSFLADREFISQKSRYNPIDNLKYVDFDVNSLIAEEEKND